MSTTLNILVADDDLDDQEFFKEAIREVKLQDYKLASVYNGNQLLDHLLRRGPYANANLVTPDIIILDINMPLKDGVTALKEIKSHEQLKSIPVFVVSTSDSEFEKKRCLELGCDGFYSKVMNLPQLKVVIVEILNKVEKRFA